MGYLTLPSGAGNMNTCLISVWFKIPSAAVTAVRARDTGISGSEDVNVMDHIIPLIMFGGQQTTLIYEGTSIIAQCSTDTSNLRLLSYATGVSHAAPIQQSCI